MAKIKDILTNLSGVSVGTWVRLIAMIISLVNLTLGVFGVTPINFDENTAYSVISIVFIIVTFVLSFWKNNSFTKAAQDADEYLHKQGLAHEESLLDEEV